MENIWLNIKVWTKITLFSVIVLYLIIFIYNNADQPLTIWYFFTKEPIKTSALEVIPITLLGGVLGTLVVRMAFRAMRQIRDLRGRSAAAKLNKDVADLKAKAAMLQTKPPGPTDQAKPTEIP